MDGDKFIKVVETEEGYIDWHVYCIVCNKMIDHAANGNMMEAAGRLHTNETGHLTILGLLMKLEEKK